MCGDFTNGLRFAPYSHGFRTKPKPTRNPLYAPDFIVHVLFNRHMRQRTAIVTLMTSHSKLLNPSFLDKRLIALRTHKHTFYVVNLFFVLHFDSSLTQPDLNSALSLP